MLSQLYIKNIAVIREATIDLDPRFNVFTGETGAGKTILISAINGVLGARLSKDIIRAGEDRALISALFTEISPPVLSAIAELGFEAENGSLLITRELGARNLCKINGRPATLQLLREISSLLIDVHGQKDNHRLLDPACHLCYLDDYGQLKPLLEEYRRLYHQITQVRRRLDQAMKNDREKEHQIDLLNYQINEIRSAHLEPGEEEGLLLHREQVRNSAHILRLFTQSKALLDGGEEGEGLASQAANLSSFLSQLAKFMPELDELSRRMEDVAYELEDCNSEIASYLDDIDYQPDTLEQIEERLDTIQRLKRKYGATIPEILDYLEQSQQQLGQIQCSVEEIQRLQSEYYAVLPQLTQAADNLTSARHKAAREFLSRVKRELEFLNMPSVKLSVTASKTGFRPNGQDNMEFLISSNAGEEPKPLAKIASGGELSRVMLSIKNVLAEKDRVGTAIFDEIDTGVSGKAAQKIGSKLREVAEHRQVICVTHLAQVAVFADHHLFISKEEREGRTFTQILPLEPFERVSEIARMISGDNLTQTAVKNAEEMLELAK